MTMAASLGIEEARVSVHAVKRQNKLCCGLFLFFFIYIFFFLFFFFIYIFYILLLLLLFILIIYKQNIINLLLGCSGMLARQIGA